MLYFVIAVLVLVVIIFGVSSGLDNYATAKQAQATIEVARVAQVNAWGNLVTIVTIALFVVIFVAVVAVLAWALYKRSTLNRSRAARVDRPLIEAGPERQVTVNDLIQLETLRMLKEMRGSSLPALLDAPKDDDEIPWLFK